MARYRAIRMTLQYRGQFVSYAHAPLWERAFVNIICLTGKIGVRIVANMTASASAQPVLRHAIAFGIAAVGGIVATSDPGRSIITGAFILVAFAVVAGLFARPPAAASAGICAGIAFGAYVNQDDFADDPGFPAMLVPLGMVALMGIVGAFAGNLIAREYRKGR